jgi:hypothetical protein
MTAQVSGRVFPQLTFPGLSAFTEVDKVTQ